jgi:two-component system OmpR family sensor kinase
MLAAMASGAIAGTLSAASAVIGADHMLSKHTDQRLAGAAEMLEGEIDEGFEEDVWEPLAEIVADENSELLSSGLRLAVFSGGHRIAGDAWVPSAVVEGCETFGKVGARTRACARTYRDWVLVAAAHSDEAALRWIYGSAGLGALLVGALLGAAASLVLTRWALGPLTRLSASIRTLRPQDADHAQLGVPSSCEEVELIREALADLLRRSHGLLSQAQRFAADAAHELRTPLTTIRAELELLAEDAREAESAALARLCERVRRLSDLLERLLVLAAPLHERCERSEAVALSDLASEAAAELPHAQRQRVRLQLEGEGLTRGDPALLRTMIANALDNALKFSGQAPVDVHLASRSPHAGAGEAEAILLEFRDRGPGVAPDQRERVFEPFFRAEPDATPGHGLGLSLIGHIARAHGGSAAFMDSERGALLRVTLPAWSRPNAT